MDINWQQLHQSVASTLCDLIRFDTTNPPGNEAPCIAYLRDRLLNSGIPSTVLESAPSRANLVARLNGDGSRRPLLLLSHVDVVPAEAEYWTHPPFAGEIAEGQVWGRGAVDTKCLTAIELELLLMFKRVGAPLKRDIILAATADEESGGAFGVGWLVENHLDLLEAEYALNEGGGVGTKTGNCWLFTCHTAEKGALWLRLRAHGRPGHGGRPEGPLAIAKLAEALHRLGHDPFPRHSVGTVDAYIRTLASTMPPAAHASLLDVLDPDKEARALDALPDRGLAAVLRASLHNTATPTILRAGQKINVIPSLAEAELDCRILPGQTIEKALAEIRDRVGDSVEIEITRSWTGTESSPDTPLFATIRRVMDELEPNSVVVPYMATGASDGRFLAQKGMIVHGFFPIKAPPEGQDAVRLSHAHNERISLENIAFATRAFGSIVQRLCL